MATEWHLSRRSDHCVGCNAALAAGSIYHAYLYEQGDNYDRRDYCTGCEPPADPPAVGFWRARRPAAGHVQSSAIAFDREAVFAFFQRLGDADTSQQRQFRFVLALLLWRKKVLKLVETTPVDGGEVWRFVAPHVSEEYRVDRPDLSDDDATRLSTQVEALLSSGMSADDLFTGSDETAVAADAADPVSSEPQAESPAEPQSA